MNEKALSILIPDIQMDVVEINSNAAEECRKIPNVTVYNQSLFDFCIEKTYDLTFTSGVMILLLKCWIKRMTSYISTAISISL